MKFTRHSQPSRRVRFYYVDISVLKKNFFRDRNYIVNDIAMEYQYQKFIINENRILSFIHTPFIK